MKKNCFKVCRFKAHYPEGNINILPMGCNAADAALKQFYQEALTMPGISPALDISRKQSLDSLNLRR